MKKSTMYTYSTALIVALGGFLMGFDASVISGAVGFIETQFQLSKLELGWAVSCLTLTSTVAMALAGPLSDKIGRKKVLVYSAILYFITASCAALAPNFIILVIARMIGGFAVGASLIVAPMYIAEIAPSEMRGKLVSLNQLNIVLGISAAFFTNYLILKYSQSDASWVQSIHLKENSWRWMLGIQTLPAVMYFLLLFIVPESPRWLIMNNQIDKAKHILSKINRQAKVDEIINSVKDGLKSGVKKEKTSLKELLNPALKLVLIAGLVVAITQQITGINSVFYYAPMIFAQTGIGTDASFSQAIMVGIINLIFTIVAMSLVDRLGRKPLLIIGVSGVVITMFLLTFAFGSAKYTLTAENTGNLPTEIIQDKLAPLFDKVYDSDVDFNRAITSALGADMVKKHNDAIVSSAIEMNSVLVLIGILGFVASFAISLGPVMWVLLSELFPNHVRGLAISFVGFVNSAVSFTVQLVFPWELVNLGNATTFFIYGVFGVIGLAFIIFKLPETKGKTLEELEVQLVRQH
jgi:sugar porter (SP) family MFS transporter